MGAPCGPSPTVRHQLRRAGRGGRRPGAFRAVGNGQRTQPGGRHRALPPGGGGRRNDRRVRGRPRPEELAARPRRGDRTAGPRSGRGVGSGPAPAGGDRRPGHRRPTTGRQPAGGQSLARGVRVHGTTSPGHRIVEPAHMELAEPSIGDRLRRVRGGRLPRRWSWPPISWGRAATLGPRTSRRPLPPPPLGIPGSPSWWPLRSARIRRCTDVVDQRVAGTAWPTLRAVPMRDVCRIGRLPLDGNRRGAHDATRWTVRTPAPGRLGWSAGQRSPSQGACRPSA